MRSGSKTTGRIAPDSGAPFGVEGEMEKNSTNGSAGAATKRRAASWLGTLIGLVGLAFVAAGVAGCGGNTTTIGVTVVAAGASTGQGASPQNPVIVLKNDTETFGASVTGGSTTTVYWQICLPVAVTNPLTQPTSCTPIPGVANSGSSNVNGYGTITQNGLYQAPTAVPQSNSFEVVATSTVNSTAFGVNYVKIDSGIRVQMIPGAATIGAGESYPIVAQVTGTTNTAVTWSVSGTVGGTTTDGTITPGGTPCAALTLTAGESCATYAAPPTGTGGSFTITATSSTDTSQSGNSSIAVAAAADPVLTSLDPTTAEQGSAQQDIYLKGSNFFATSAVLVNGAPVPPTWLSPALIRITIPSNLLSQGPSLNIVVQRQNGDMSLAQTLPVNPERPSVVASSPDSVTTTSAGFGVALTGGFFSQAATGATFDGFPGTGTGTAVAATFSSSRQMTANLPAGSLSTPGLYPIVVQNTNVTAGTPSTSATNIAVTPATGTLLSAPVATIGVGTGASAIAVDEADGLAVVANTGANSVSIISLATNAVVSTVAVGNTPTGVAIDDNLSANGLHNIAVVVNRVDGTLSTIDLVTDAVTATYTLPALPPAQPGQTSGPQYFAIGINPATHRGLVAAASTNVAAAIDLSSGVPAAPPPNQPASIGGSNTNYGTGPNPEIAIDPRLNWAIVTAGGGGIPVVSFVDLGRDAGGADPGRSAAFIGDMALPAEVEGVGINPETHQVLLTTPTLGNFTTFSLLNQAVSSIPFTNQNVAVNEPGYVAAAASALPNIGVAVNRTGNDAAVLDLQNHVVIEKVTVGNVPEAVVIDPVTDEALVVNQGDGTVSVLSLGTVRSSASLGAAAAPQITLSSPEIGYVSASPLTLTVNGGGFATGASPAQVYLDGTPVASVVNSTGRQIIATVPASMLGSARRYSVYVQNPGQTVISNIEDLTVVQSVAVGAQPFGVGIDTDCDVAAVTNSGDNTVSIVALSANAPPPLKTCVSAGAVGTVGPPIPVGTKPQGIAIDPLIGMAVVANNGSSDATIIDLTETNPPAPITLSCNSCTNVTGVGMNLDSQTAYVTGLEQPSQFSTTPTGTIAGINMPTNGFPSGATAAGSIINLDPTPQAVAVDLYSKFLGIATGGQSTSAIDVYNLQDAQKDSVTGGFDLPTGILFDPVNQVFVAANSLVNNVGFIDPVAGIASFAQVGMNPSALDYNYQTSTLVTANNQSQTLSIMAYMCPPGIGTGNCSAPQVRAILGLGGSPQFSVAIDPKLNLAVLTDQANNRVLLIPLP